VGVVATGFAVREPPLAAGVRRLRQMGFAVRLGEHVLARDGYLAGDDATRAGELIAMLEEPDVRAVWFARGGYGSARILERLPWSELARGDKLLVGYSDVTALLSAAVERTRSRCLYGPVVAELGWSTAYDAASLRALLGGRGFERRVRARDVVLPGRARGPIAGGNLTLLASLCGTAFQPDLRGKVLLLEEVGEEAYRIDRLLTQLHLAGCFAGIRAVLLGAMRAPRRRRFPPDRRLDEVLTERFAALGVPVVRGLPVGHVPGKWTLPIGGQAEIDCAARRLRFAP